MTAAATSVHLPATRTPDPASGTPIVVPIALGERSYDIYSRLLKDNIIFLGTAIDDSGTLRVTGGRVLCVTALGDSVRTAQQRAYQVLQGVQFDGMQYRRDIGHRALKR